MPNRQETTLLIAALSLLLAAAAQDAVAQSNECIDQIDALSSQLDDYESELAEKVDIELDTTEGKKTVETNKVGGVKPVEAWFTPDQHGVSAAREKLKQARNFADADDSSSCQDAVNQVDTAINSS